MKVFSAKNRPVHLGPYPVERLKRTSKVDLSSVPDMAPLTFRRTEMPENIVNAMGEYQAMLDAIRDGLINNIEAVIPQDPRIRADHLKAFGYFNDAAMIGICALPDVALLDQPILNPDIDRLADALRTRQTKTLASGIDVIMADLKDSMEAPPSTIEDHTHAVVFLYDNPRAFQQNEAGCDWLCDAHAHRASLRASETTSVLANYIRLLGFDAKSHSASASDVNLNSLAVAAGLVWVKDGALVAPFVRHNFGLGAITCRMDLAVDLPLAPPSQQTWLSAQWASWWLGTGGNKTVWNNDPYKRRRFVDGPHPFETLKRAEKPTTFIDEEHVARVPKRTDMFARAQFGDMGKTLQEGAKGGYYARKSAPSFAQRRALGAFVLLQDGLPNPDGTRPTDSKRNADNLKATSYFLGVDAVGLSRCPDWAWYSHDATGEKIDPPHPNAISMIVDQGFETMEGASGDDWISVAQSMRAYLRFSLLGGVIAKQIRNLGYKAKAHSVMDGDVLQPPLLLLSGLGEVSRIGEVILNPYLGPRLKSGIVTTDIPMTHDKPIDFGLQNFCETCNKCARECPSGAITAGPKLMFNGYEIWKSDSQKCATYRITTEGGAMCGRCMKTCPWNLEGLFAEAPFRWAASNLPKLAKPLAKLDDMVGRGELNDVKKWWWDIELYEDGGYKPARKPINRRALSKNLDLKYEDQTLAVYPAHLAPHPWPYPFIMDREKGIEAYEKMISAEEYQKQLSSGSLSPVHRYSASGTSPVLRVEVSHVEKMTDAITKYEFKSLDGKELPAWSAGAHLDVLVAPEFLRQYSMSGDPANSERYQIGVLREDGGRGGSKTMHRIFRPGRKVFISKPINHFELAECASKTFLMGGGIGVTPMIAFAHQLFAKEKEFELHYSARQENSAGYLLDLAAVPWADRVKYHFSSQGQYADFTRILKGYRKDWHVYACGPHRYMEGVIEAALAEGFPEDATHVEYFSTPEIPEYENHAFTLKLEKSDKEIAVPADKDAATVLVEHGYAVDLKCSDGICGVCQCGLLYGEVEHRDFVLSKKQRQSTIILCQSRAAKAGGILHIDL